MNTRKHVLIIAALLAPLLSLAADSGQSSFQAARSLETTGHPEEAVLQYLGIPGAEHAAATLVRPQPEKYLALLASAGHRAPSPIAKLIEGDLHLALGDAQHALACYREVAKSAARTDTEGWEDGCMPANYYPVEPAANTLAPNQLIFPFTIGPGSHRDNWLIRRFIALDAMDDAEHEFERIWDLHRRAQNPPIEIRRILDFESKTLTNQTFLVTPAVYGGKALQFAIDYAYFLNRRGKTEEALQLLLKPLHVMDMDVNPDLGASLQPVANEAAQRCPAMPPYRDMLPFGWQVYSYSGLSRNDFIRLVCGEFQQAGRIREVENALRTEIARGSLRTRRVLARVRLLQIDPAGALEQEQAYIAEKNFDPFTATYRLGMVYEDLQLPLQAAAEYERLLALPSPETAVPLPDPEARDLGQRAMPQQDWNNPQSHSKEDAIERLQRIYVANGKTNELLELSLKRFELLPRSISDFNLVQETADRFRAAGKAEDYAAWVAGQASSAIEPEARANLFWSINDSTKTLEALGGCRNPDTIKRWQARFKKTEERKALLDVILALDPADSRARLERLDLLPDPLGPDAIADLEKLLAPDAASAFPRGKGSHNGTRFRNAHDLAYRLMRLYEKENRIDQLVALGMRVAKGEKPFVNLGEIDRDEYYFYAEDGLKGDLQATLSLLVQHAAPQTLDALSVAWQALPDHPEKRQMERKRASRLFPSKPQTAIPWVNVPAAATLLASSENVLGLAADDRYVYAGHPWGVAVYDHAGTPVVRIALGAAALQLEMCGGYLWAGTPVGLDRIEPDGWQVAYLPLNQDLPPERREPENRDFENGVCSLAADGNVLWIGTRRNIKRLDLENNSLRAFSHEELQTPSHHDLNNLLLDDDFVWADGREACRRYTRETGSWDKVQYNDKPVHLIGMIDGRLFGNVNLGEPLRDRPCLIDRHALETTPILIDGNLTEAQRCINGPFSWFGTYGGQPVFGPGTPAYAYDAKTGRLNSIASAGEQTNLPIESPIPEGLREGQPRLQPNGIWTCYDNVSLRHTVCGLPCNVSEWSLLALPDGTRVLGGKHSSSPRYIYPAEDWPDLHPRRRENHSGGLHFISPDNRMTRVSSIPASNAILGDNVFSIAPDPDGDRLWLCTDAGIALLDSEHAALDAFTELDGLRANRVVSGTPVGNKMYFSSSWGDRSGGIMVLDPLTKVFTSITRADGLATDKIVSLKATDRNLEIIYGLDDMRGSGKDFDYRASSPGTYDPASGTLTRPEAVSGISRADAERRQKANHPLGHDMPLLGGHIICRESRNGLTYLCGTRGLVIAKEPLKSGPEPELLAVTALVNDQLHLIEEAKAIPIEKPITRERFMELANHPNPYVQANAFGQAGFSEVVLESDEFIPMAEERMHSDCLRLRCSILFALSRSGHNNALIPVLKEALSDSYGPNRDFATVELCKRGFVPDNRFLKGILEEINRGDMLFGADSIIGVQRSREDLLKAVAPIASPKVFKLLIDHPPTYQNYDNAEKVFPQLCSSLCRHPEAADLLLKAYDADQHNPRQREFALHAFQCTGTNLLSKLQAALQSNDRVVRSNAARACGAIGDPSSIQPLMKAMDLESGLSRASIVWALGELKAAEALPMLETLYVDVRNDEERARHAGFRSGQSAAAMRSEYDSIRNVDAVGKDWDELKNAHAPQPIDPKQNEDLLSTKHIIEAIGKIDAAASQSFYRKLAGDEQSSSRRIAAEKLASALGTDRDGNLPILRGLLADQDLDTRIIAGASLLVLGDASAEPHVLEWLGSDKLWIKQKALAQLFRVGNPNAIAFAQAKVNEIARTEATTYEKEQLAHRAGKLLKHMAATGRNNDE